MESNRILKPVCHSCKLLVDPLFLVPCKIVHCDCFFCHKCLTSRYKYSKAKVVSLSTANHRGVNWKCPYCMSRCQCNDCVEVGRAPVKKKGMSMRDTIRHFYKRKRIRKRKYKSGVRVYCGTYQVNPNNHLVFLQSCSPIAYLPQHQ